MKINIKHFDQLNRHAPKAIEILKRFYDWDGKRILIRSQELDASDLKDASDRLLEQMEIIVQAAEQEDRGFSEDEQKAFDQLKHWQQRFSQSYDKEKPSNALPPQSRDYRSTDDLERLYQKPGTVSLDKDAPLQRNQSMVDWCRQHNPGMRTDCNIGGLVKHWLTGEGSEAEQRAMVQTGSGGLLIPSMLSGQIIDLMRNKTQVINAGAQVWPMVNNNLTIPRQVSDPEPGWRAELAHTKRSSVTFEPVILKSCSLSMIIALSNELLQDATGLNAFLVRVMAEAMGQAVDLAALSGLGTKVGEDRIEPIGVLNTPGILSHTGTLNSYGVFSEAVTKITSRNGEPNAMLWSPADAGVVDALSDSTGQPLRPPESWSRFAKLDTNQLIDGTAILGDWSNLVIGMQSNLRLDVSTEASLPQEGSHAAIDLFSQHGTALRVTLRGDVGVLRPDQFCELTLTQPTRKKSAA